MPRVAEAIHVIEKDEENENLRCTNRQRREWETGHWVIGKATAESLVGGMVYVHRGQDLPSHIGGKIIAVFHQEGTDEKRQVIRFRKLPLGKNVVAEKKGWGNERKIDWKVAPSAKAEVEVLNDDDESTFPEGTEKYKLHRSRERDSALSRKAKRLRLLKTGKLECEVCLFDFARQFGPHGEGFIEAHHKVPVSQLDGKSKTRVADLALVCSNCHRMLHRGKPLPTVERLRTLRKNET